MEAEWYVHDNGVQKGPFTEERLYDMASQGAFGADAQKWKEGWSSWKPLFPPAAPRPGPFERNDAPFANYALPAMPNPSSAGSTKIAAGICGIILGGLGVHKFIIGATGAGITMLLISIVGGCFTAGLATAVMHIIGLVEGIIYLTRSDEQFYREYVVGKKGWF